MAFAKTVEHYAAFLYPNDTDSSSRINLYCADRHRLYLLFYEDGVNLPDNSFSANTNTGVAYAPLSQYPSYIDMLRNEKPVRVTFRPEDTPARYVVWVSQEEPGEGEI